MRTGQPAQVATGAFFRHNRHCASFAHYGFRISHATDNAATGSAFKGVGAPRAMIIEGTRLALHAEKLAGTARMLVQTAQP